MSPLSTYFSDHAPLIILSLICAFAGGYFSADKRSPWFRDYLVAAAYEFPRSMVLILVGMGGVVGYIIGVIGHGN